MKACWLVYPPKIKKGPSWKRKALLHLSKLRLFCCTKLPVNESVVKRNMISFVFLMLKGKDCETPLTYNNQMIDDR
jgi:hypothetical protein